MWKDLRFPYIYNCSLLSKILVHPATSPSASVASVAEEWSDALSPSSISTEGTVEKEVWVRSMAMEPPENYLAPAP